MKICVSDDSKIRFADEKLIVNPYMLKTNYDSYGCCTIPCFYLLPVNRETIAKALCFTSTPSCEKCINSYCYTLTGSMR